MVTLLSIYPPSSYCYSPCSIEVLPLHFTTAFTYLQVVSSFTRNVYCLKTDRNWIKILILKSLLRPFAFEVSFIVIRQVYDSDMNFEKKNNKEKRKNLPFLFSYTLNNHWAWDFLWCDTHCSSHYAALSWLLMKLLSIFHPNAKDFPGKLKHDFVLWPLSPRCISRV